MKILNLCKNYQAARTAYFRTIQFGTFKRTRHSDLTAFTDCGEQEVEFRFVSVNSPDALRGCRFDQVILHGSMHLDDETRAIVRCCLL